jgi:hypothetical protein
MSSPTLDEQPNIMAPPTAPLGPLLAEAIYPSSTAAKAALQEHARVNGYGIGIESSTQKRIFFRCAKGGKYDDRFKDPTVQISKQCKNTSTMKTDCKFKAVVRQQENGQWKLEVLDNNHNHGPLAALAALPQYRTALLTPEERLKVKQMNSENLSASQILTSLRNANPELNLIPRDIYNLLASFRLDELAGQTPTEWLLEVYLPNDLSKDLLTNYIETPRERLQSKRLHKSRYSST